LKRFAHVAAGVCASRVAGVNIFLREIPPIVTGAPPAVSLQAQSSKTPATEESSIFEGIATVNSMSGAEKQKVQSWSSKSLKEHEQD
jgi:hypothetical protein